MSYANRECLLASVGGEYCSDNLLSQVITREHIITKKASRRHSIVIPKDLLGSDNNSIPLCRWHHTDLDNRKYKAYAQEGIVGLVKFMGVYDRAPLEERRRQQQIQLTDLFEEFHTEIVRGFSWGFVPAHRKAEYKFAADLLSRFIEQWEANGFDITEENWELYNSRHRLWVIEANDLSSNRLDLLRAA